MSKYTITFFLTLIFLCVACAEEKVDITTENVKPQTAPQKADSKSVVIDYSEFPKNASGKEVWTKKVKTGKADVKVVLDKELNQKVLNLKSDEASYFFQKELKNFDLNKNGIVSWKWKVAQHPKGGDVRRGSTDDQAIQVLLAFDGKYIISYIWDPTAPVGYTKDSSIPFLLAQKVLVLQSGEDKLNQWFSFRRDIKADFKKLYKKDAPKLVGVAVQINSQHTDSKCESFLSPIVFEGN